MRKILLDLTETIIFFVLTIMMNSYVFAKFYSWFLTATFGYKAITIFEAAGVLMIVSFFTLNRKIDHENKHNSKKMWDEFGESIIFNFVYILIGYTIFKIISNS